MKTPTLFGFFIVVLLVLPGGHLVACAQGSNPTVEGAGQVSSSTPSLDLSGSLLVGEGESESAVSDEGNKETLSLEADVRDKSVYQILRLAEDAYNQERFEEVAAYYQALLSRGVVNGDLYFNLGNTYFRMGDFGRAVLYYEKALKLRPRDADIRHNLEYTRTFLIDAPPKKPFSSLDAVLVLHNRTTFNETLWILVFLNLFLVLLVAAKTLGFGFTRSVYYGYVRGIVVTLFVLQFLSAGVKIWREGNVREAVVLEDSVQAKASPNAEEVLAEINSGTKVRLIRTRNGFAYIRLPNGTPAFVPEEAIAEI